MLKRHIIQTDKAFTMADLRVFKNETAEIATLNGMLRIRVREEDKREYLASLFIYAEEVTRGHHYDS